MAFLKGLRPASLFAALSSGALLLLSAACAKPPGERQPPLQMSAPEGISYLAVGAAERVEVRVQPGGSITWMRETRDAAAGVSTLHELRWTGNTKPLLSALSNVMYELANTPLGALGIRDGRERWRALRISSGEAISVLTPTMNRAAIFAALEQTLLRPLEVHGPEPFGRLPFQAVATAIAACHQRDHTSFHVVAVADTDSVDYHQQISDTSQDGCARLALQPLAQALRERKHSRLRPRHGLTEGGGRIEVRRGPAAQSAAESAWPEVPRSEPNERDAPPTLYGFETAPVAVPSARFSILPAAKPARGEPIALEFRTRIFQRGVYAEPRRVWRIVVRSDETARIAWQLWAGSRDFAVIEVTFETQPPAERIAALFALARSLRLNERKRWFCSETNIEITTDDDDGDDAEHWASRQSQDPRVRPTIPIEAFPTCERIAGMAVAMQALLSRALISEPLEQAVIPVILGLRDCRAAGLDDAHAVLEYARPGAPARLEAVPHHAGALGIACARSTLSTFDLPSAVRQLWRSGTLRVVAKEAPWQTNEIKALAEEPTAEKEASVAYKTHW